MYNVVYQLGKSELQKDPFLGWKINNKYLVEYAEEVLLELLRIPPYEFPRWFPHEEFRLAIAEAIEIQSSKL